MTPIPGPGKACRELMDSALAPQQTFYPAFYSTADVAMFDAIGHDN